jgi:hypothetical protein
MDTSARLLDRIFEFRVPTLPLEVRMQLRSFLWFAGIICAMLDTAIFLVILPILGHILRLCFYAWAAILWLGRSVAKFGPIQSLLQMKGRSDAKY